MNHGVWCRCNHGYAFPREKLDDFIVWGFPASGSGVLRCFKNLIVFWISLRDSPFLFELDQWMVWFCSFLLLQSTTYCYSCPGDIEYNSVRALNAKRTHCPIPRRVFNIPTLLLRTTIFDGTSLPAGKLISSNVMKSMGTRCFRGEGQVKAHVGHGRHHPSWSNSQLPNPFPFTFRSCRGVLPGQFQNWSDGRIDIVL